jgi:Na+-translocating ferredoxin:NAD+ oxidoreductase RnfE subunit
MASRITTRIPLAIEPSLIIGLGIIPALPAAKGVAQALLLSSGIMLVQIGTIALLFLLHRAILPRYTLFFTVVFAGGCTALWSMVADAIVPDLFLSLSFYPYLLPAMLPILLSARVFEPFPGRREPIFRAIITGLSACAMLCVVALLRETIGSGTLCGYPIRYSPPFAWAASTCGALTIAALIAGIVAAFHHTTTPRARESNHAS